MLTQIQYYRYEELLTRCAVEEASLTLIRNDHAFGLLIAEDAHEDSVLHQTYLSNVQYLSVIGDDFTFKDYDAVILESQGDMWHARVPEEYNISLPNPSTMAYHIIFIDDQEYQSMLDHMAKDRAYPIFQSAQRHFGNLPGFSFVGDTLNAPSLYADGI